MEAILILLFVIGYLSITLEHPLKLDKTVPALMMAALMWALLAIGFQNGWFSVVDGHGAIFNINSGDIHQQEHGFEGLLLHHVGKVAEILIFLIGAMTIVELIDLHRGFDVLKDMVKTKSKIRLLWITGIVGFILSAVIDNLTATIVLISLLRKLIHNREERIWYASLIIIATNAGGAWSPIGDVTTTMLWIAKKVTAGGLSEYIIIPAILCFVVPYALASRMKIFRGNIEVNEKTHEERERLLSSKTMLWLGLGAIVFVPIFKTLTHLPPYVGMMLSLAVVWMVSEYIHPEVNFDKSKKHLYSANNALSKIEISSILFFLGILMAVASLESLVFGSINGVEVGTLRYAAESISNAIPNMDFVIILLGVLSAVIDNVPLVAASMGMYTYEIDHPAWHFIAYSAGTGGSMLIIGSAAGVAAMGMEKIDFIWYLKKITWLAFAGFIAGAMAFLFIEHYIR
ncbi:sodium:proton antiporter NhaD [Flavobacterium helocola]|uniref:Sodium:proton antiporter NhaD n=1 Tax=Flavobacterium helocola TaxID=3139139 RepID=A0ABU9I5Y0_9FLAO